MKLFLTNMKISCFVYCYSDQWFAAHTTYIKTTSDYIHNTKTIQWWFKAVGLWRKDQKVREEVVLLISMRNQLSMIITLVIKLLKLSPSFPRTQLGIYKPARSRHRHRRWWPLRPLMKSLLTILPMAVNLTLNFLCRNNLCWEK